MDVRINSPGVGEKLDPVEWINQNVAMNLMLKAPSHAMGNDLSDEPNIEIPQMMTMPIANYQQKHELTKIT